MPQVLLFAVGGAVLLPILLVLYAWSIKKIGDRSFRFRRIEQWAVLGGGWIVLAAFLFELLRLYEAVRQQ